MTKEYIAHKSVDGRVQTIKDHCQNTAELAEMFAQPLKFERLAYAAGNLHDIGKYSDAFQKRINGGSNHTDHSSAGAQELEKTDTQILMRRMLQSVIAGHHSGLLNIGSEYSHDHDNTLMWRLEKAVDDYSAYKEEIHIPSIPVSRFNAPHPYEYFYASFMTRMVFSCLTDADFLDTENFMTPGVRTTEYESIPVLCSRLLDWLEQKGWLRGASGLNEARSYILNTCIQTAAETKGLYTLTVPTGGGKTIASLAFALKHAEKYQMDRVIYVIPYCSIIDPTVNVFQSILGSRNVLAHYSESEFNDTDNDEMNAKRLSSENWDMPVVVTTAVQFFESLYSNKTSKCRKLHNIANAVVVFDEVQTLPIHLLDPCVAAIEQLVTNAGCTCVLCTATQPALQEEVHKFDRNVEMHEICGNLTNYSAVFKRVKYQYIGLRSDHDLEDLLASKNQVLCIVSTVRQAYNLYHDLKKRGFSVFSLSSNILPIDRMKILEEVKDRLKNMQDCILIATSIIEAGVDIDFPVVYRSYAGIDSMIQAGGRCNREGKRPRDQSVVYLFESEKKYKIPSSMDRPRQEAEPYKGRDITDHRIEEQYFKELYRDSETDQEGIVSMLNCRQTAFEDAADRFHMIENDTWTLYVPVDEQSTELLSGLIDENVNLNRRQYRMLGRYSLQLYENRLKYLAGSIAVIDSVGKTAVLSNTSLYDSQCGLSFSEEDAESIIF